MVFLDILIDFALQIALTLGVVIVFGFFIALCNKKFYSNFGGYGKIVCYATGVIGTPVHECAHALFCLIFGHKIVEIKLFQVGSEDGTLGYVRHSYKPKNLYQKIGNFFIGIAPIVVISTLLYGLSWLILTDFTKAINANIQTSNILKDFTKVLVGVYNTLVLFFSKIDSWQWWVFVVIASFLALHMNLSKPDIKGAVSGLIFLMLVILIVDIVLGLIDIRILNSVTLFVLRMSSYLLCVLLLSAIISLLLVAVSYIFKITKKVNNRF